MSNEDLPKDDGASDYRDSARSAGLEWCFKPGGGPRMTRYLTEKGEPIRCPGDIPSDFSRDQETCYYSGVLMEWLLGIPNEGRASAYARYHIKIKNMWIAPNGDPVMPSAQVLRKKIKDISYQPNWLERKWIGYDIWWATKVKPGAEPNQLLCLLRVCGDDYLKRWRDQHPDWKKCIRDYFCGWRDECKIEEADDIEPHMIRYIEAL